MSRQYALGMAKATRAQRMRAGPKGSMHGPSIKNGATYEALRRKYGKSRAAAISNGVLNRGWKRGVHRRK